MVYLQVVGELWRPTGSAYNVDGVLKVMVSGLEEELAARRKGGSGYAANQKAPSMPVSGDGGSDGRPVLSQGGDFGLLWKAVSRMYRWVVQRRR